MFAWSQLHFSAIPVSISAISLTGRQAWQNVNSKRRCKEFKIYMKGKEIRKRDIYMLLSLFLLFSRRGFQQLNFE
jgi:hypothetical protein